MEREIVLVQKESGQENVQAFSLRLPFPPTVNHIWVRGKKGFYMSDKGKQFFWDAFVMIREWKMSNVMPLNLPLKLAVKIIFGAYLPNNRKRDLDNLLKGLQDALVKCGILADDSLVEDVRIHKAGIDPRKIGFVEAAITVLQEN